MERSLSRLGILLVAFGTSNIDTKRKTIDEIDREVKKAFQKHTVYTAFTSSKERGLLLKKAGVKTYSMEECLNRMQEEQIHKLIIQPLYIRNGLERIRMLKVLEDYAGSFASIIVGDSLLEQKQDYEHIISGLKTELPRLEPEEGIVFMGHGTKHASGDVKESMNDVFVEYGLWNWHMAFLEEKPYIWDMVNIIKQHHYRKLYLTPFLIVAGKHALMDMVGEKEDTWESILISNGYEVEPILRGLGEYKFISELVIAHIKKAIEDNEV